MTDIAQVDNVDKVRSAEFVKLTVVNTGTDEVYTFSTSFKHENINGQDYTPMGGLVNIGQQQRDLRVTSFDTSISLVGIDPVNINLVLGKNIRGSEIEIYRGFYDDNYQLVNSVLRFTGIVTSYTVSETREGSDDMFGIVINCSSYKTVLENNVGGRRTNRDTWTYFYASTDTSMDGVEKLSGAYFDFGVPVK
jgi:hypothetical protein